jgi:hypothetical protein
MIITKEISIDIINYLQLKKKMTIDDISASMNTSSSHIKDIINKKSNLTIKNVNIYLKKTNMYFWDFADKAVQKKNLSKKAKTKIKICKEIFSYIEKKGCNKKNL